MLWVVKVGNRRLSLAGQHIFIRVIFFFPSKQSDIRIYNKKPLFSETNGKQAKPEREKETFGPISLPTSLPPNNCMLLIRLLKEILYPRRAQRVCGGVQMEGGLSPAALRGSSLNELVKKNKK